MADQVGDANDVLSAETTGLLYGLRAVSAAVLIYDHVNTLSILDIAMFIVWAAFSFFRMHAISDRNWALSMTIGILNMVPVAVNAYIRFGATSYSMVDLPAMGIWCLADETGLLSSETQTASLTRLPVILSDIIVIVATWRRTFRLRRIAVQIGMQTPLATMLLYDGTAYFGIAVALNVVDVIGIASTILQNVGAFLPAFSSMIVSHFLLDLYDIADGAPGHPTTTSTQIGPPEVSDHQRTSHHFTTVMDDVEE
ncbi:hypothetical protein CERSUDRAFT_121747 [Gelatoporia subvermispora B]|uniref:Uncharacterized protein n=1 Tax=Ceriporiopsis subvermispora (strain B) TaxID=914234 RepID=M2PS64_CERS8|nr:hypothetical protein CERSUDRAFT_121747 [Gelatoporia subvermispora B]